MNDPNNTLNNYQLFKETSLMGRYINTDHISKALQKAAVNFEVNQIGKSTLREPIHLIKAGT